MWRGKQEGRGGGLLDTEGTWQVVPVVVVPVVVAVPVAVVVVFVEAAAG